METDWREILRFSQKELKQNEKDKLCESLSWMEADDIDLNFGDLKTLFRLAQDILKYKSEQVNNLIGKSKKKVKTKEKSTLTDFPSKSSDFTFETISHQEEVIKANKEILEQLYADIAELEERKRKYNDKSFQPDSDSSRNTLSEINAVALLESEVSKRNSHIRKLLGDVKILEEDNTTLKDKLSIFKDKLKEATLLIENLTEQLFTLNKNNSSLKEYVGKTEQEKANLSIELENLKKEMNDKDLQYEKVEEVVKSKIEDLEELVKSQSKRIKRLSDENNKLKEDLNTSTKKTKSPKIESQEEIKINELQEKLAEASEEMMKSAYLIQLLQNENKQVRSMIDDGLDCSSIREQKNESDDGKEKSIIKKLKNKIKLLNNTIQNSDDLIAMREKELAEITQQLQLLQSDDGINSLIDSIKKNKRDLKIQNEGIKNLVKEVNYLNEIINQLQLENETMREKMQIPKSTKIATHGILKEFDNLKMNNMELTKLLKEYENKFILVEIDNHEKDKTITNLKTMIKASNLNNSHLNDNDEQDKEKTTTNTISNQKKIQTSDMQIIIEENEGLRNSLTEILNFLKDNSDTSSGLLAMQCPTLEAILNSMEARKAAGWFSPHMRTVMELKSALGSKDALMGALHESRQETFKIMSKLSKEEQKTSDLEKILQEYKTNAGKTEEDNYISNSPEISTGEFGNWMSQAENEIIDFKDANDILSYISKANICFENKYKQALQYFHKKFAALFEKFTALNVNASDDHNKWNIQEEHYKAEIESLKSQIHGIDDESSDNSPGLISDTKSNVNRKYIFLEESFKQIRTFNENIKNDYLEYKKERINEAFQYEKKIQYFILSVINLSDKLRNSVPVELFLKQNDELNKIVIDYRNAFEMNTMKTVQSEDFFKQLKESKSEILESPTKETQKISVTSEQLKDSKTEKNSLINQKQFQSIYDELQLKNKEIEKLEQEIKDLHILQSEIIDKTIHLDSCENINFFKEQIRKLTEENRTLKEHYADVNNKLDNVVLQLEAYKNKKLSNDKENNILRHQILDLQSQSDKKAIIARISGEVLLAQMQLSVNQEKIESLKIALNREKQLRAETEEILINRQNVFDIYTLRYDTKLRNMNEVINILRQQYQGCLPLISVESFYKKTEELNRKINYYDEKLSEIEDLQSSLITKHNIYDQIINMSTKCIDSDDTCPHKIKNIISKETQKLEIEHYKKKLASFEQSHRNLLERCSYLEKTLVLVNQGFKVNDFSSKNGYHRKQTNENIDLKVEDIQSGDESSSSRKSRTQTLSHPKMDIKAIEATNVKDNVINKINVYHTLKAPTKNMHTQTLVNKIKFDIKSTQTDKDKNKNEFKILIDKLTTEKTRYENVIHEMTTIAKNHEQQLSHLNNENKKVTEVVKNLTDQNKHKNELNDELQSLNQSLKLEINNLKTNQKQDIDKLNETTNAENQNLLTQIKKIETDKNEVIAEYKQLLKKEREDYTTSLKEFQSKLKDLQRKLDKRETVAVTSKDDANKETSNKYTLKICDLEEKCFMLQSELDGYKTDFESQQGELERWKCLAFERLTKMEQLSAQLKERHNQEVDSYKAENQHWLTQLKETQREHIELRARLTEQKTLHLKQLNEKENQIEQLRSVVNNLKSQILNMQTMLTINDPSFDLSAIVEVEEASDGVSQGSERLELKFDSTVDFNDTQDELKMPCTSTAIWQEPLVERLRREKQLMSKQNGMLRRQIKVLAARERRSRLDAQNLRNQVYRISTAGGKVVSAESAVLQQRVASLQAQLTSARRDATSHVALWDKWKRAQQSADRWQARYEEKCQEIKKLEISLNLSKSALSRLEKEKRILLSRMENEREEKHLAIEKQEVEGTEKVSNYECQTPPPVSSRALMGRVEAQQRRIAALEIAERGNETLVTEYEKSLAEVASLKGQVLKLESTLLEAQIRSPLNPTTDTQPELQYWRNYCDMLKEENMQLTLRVNSIDIVPTSAHHQRVSDLEQTVLTLRGLVSKLQAEQKSSSTNQKRIDSRPGSGRSGNDKARTQLESYRIEISNLKRSISEKDTLLEKSKDMLKVAAEREDDLLRENLLLRRRLDQLTEGRDSFISA